MAIGSLSSLGLGSKVLNYDVIDKLKDADEKALIAPLDKKMEQNVEKQKALVEIKTLLSALKGPVKMLSDYSTYISRKSNVTGDALSASVGAGVPIQDIKVDVQNLAQGDINELGAKFSSRDDIFSQVDTTLKFYTQNKDYAVDIKAGMTLGDVAQSITDATNGEVMGIVMKTGGNDPYQLMVNTKNTGEDNRIYFGSHLQSTLTNKNALSLGVDGSGKSEVSLNLKGADGNMHEVPIMLELPESASIKQKNTAIQKAMEQALENDPNFKDLIANGDISIDTLHGGESLIINDRRGGNIEVKGSKAKELGFLQTTTQESDLLKSSRTIKEGKLEGVISLNGQKLNLSTLTKEGNTSEENTDAIIQAINAKEGLNAFRNAEGKLVINSKTGMLTIKGEDALGKNSLKDLGLNAGMVQSYEASQDTLFMSKNLQKASDSEFTYNGVSITRPTNEVNDVINGVNITLEQTTEPNKPAIISVSRDNQAIIDSLKEFVKAYNELIPKLDEDTRYDADTKIAGIFNGVGDIRTIRSSLNNVFSYSVHTDNGVESLMKYGLSLDDKGVMSLDEAKLSSALNSNPKATQDFFYGSDSKDMGGREIHQEGIFSKFNQVIANLIDGGSAKLKIYEDSLDRDAKSLTKDKENAQELLKTRYNIMAERFAAYDSQISKANQKFNSVQMMIDQAAAKKN
ncbi:flagellar filament capping protein FliD [Helicobacter pylori]|uniref:flagellar filament capping protein FliD n=1 Tax=Helicobacter pylori TaxID=210 RepID=UPI00287B9E19|nr:flagellar filament capping protein FliD [Helicobacter pylori]WNE31914.1 flagellar filament capping protein FliD [Helicobacter pylori]WNE33338.1 flagellar filament capping protein FliD [Helicobacter pylori]WNE34766.1 flagellar filament capping protein FliD [Helicobacter pylori]WNE36189.1 flagellar filament capping protein FliD [Helicobacter pylori]WNE37618.1 flagellar filament capping protein FliD [Helicobacter pylori]